MSADQPEISPVSLEQPSKYLRTPKISSIVCMHVAAVLTVHKISNGRWRQRKKRKPKYAASSRCYVGDGVRAAGYACAGRPLAMAHQSALQLQPTQTRTQTHKEASE
eukprot:COSAG01_NODE_957_length_12474_cov_44.298182_16_plen_107_part_00